MTTSHETLHKMSKKFQDKMEFWPNPRHGANYAVAAALVEVALAIRDLGFGNAATSQGAIELLSQELRDGLAAIVLSLDNK